LPHPRRRTCPRHRGLLAPLSRTLYPGHLQSTRIHPRPIYKLGPRQPCPLSQGHVARVGSWRSPRTTAPPCIPRRIPSPAHSGSPRGRSRPPERLRPPLARQFQPSGGTARTRFKLDDLFRLRSGWKHGCRRAATDICISRSTATAAASTRMRWPSCCRASSWSRAIAQSSATASPSLFARCNRSFNPRSHHLSSFFSRELEYSAIV